MYSHCLGRWKAKHFTEKVKLHHSKCIQQAYPFSVVIVPKQALFVCFEIHIAVYKVRCHANEGSAIYKFIPLVVEVYGS